MKCRIKLITSIVLAIIVIASLTACSSVDPTGITFDVPVQSMSLKMTTRSVDTVSSDNVVGTQEVTATILPANATNQKVTWSVAWENFTHPDKIGDYLTITPNSDNGLKATVTCLQRFSGSATITVTSQANSSVKATISVRCSEDRLAGTWIWNEKLSYLGEPVFSIECGGVTYNNGYYCDSAVMGEDLYYTLSYRTDSSFVNVATYAGTDCDPCPVTWASPEYRVFTITTTYSEYLASYGNSGYSNEELDFFIEALESNATKVNLIEYATAKINVDVDPGSLVIYKSAQTKQTEIYVTMDEDVWKTGDRATVIFLKTEIATSTPSLRGLFGLPVSISGDDCNDEGHLMGSNYHIYIVHFYFDGATVLGTSTSIEVVPFTVNGTSYYARAGMTWNEWCNNTGYCPGGFTCAEGASSVTTSDGKTITFSDGSTPSSSSVIESSGVYTSA